VLVALRMLLNVYVCFLGWVVVECCILAVLCFLVLIWSFSFYSYILFLYPIFSMYIVLWFLFTLKIVLILPMRSL